MKIVKDIEVKLGDYALINMAYKNVIFTSEYFLQSVFLENCIFIDCDFSKVKFENNGKLTFNNVISKNNNFGNFTNNVRIPYTNNNSGSWFSISGDNK